MRTIEEKKKMGRPTDAPKSYRESFRLSEEDMNKIRFCMEKAGMSKTDVIRGNYSMFFDRYEPVPKKPE